MVRACAMSERLKGLTPPWTKEIKWTNESNDGDYDKFFFLASSDKEKEECLSGEKKAWCMLK